MLKIKHRVASVLLTLCMMIGLFGVFGLAMPVRAKAAGTYVVTVNTGTANWNDALSVFVQLNALGNNGTLTVDTTGQDLDHIQHFVFDALAGTGRTLVVKHQGATYTIRGAAESADHLRMGSILLGHNHSFAILDAYRK